MRRGVSSWQSIRIIGACCATELAAPHMQHCSLHPKIKKPPPPPPPVASVVHHTDCTPPDTTAVSRAGRHKQLEWSCCSSLSRQLAWSPQSAVVSCSYRLIACSVINVYTPNSGSGLKRLTYRIQQWDKQFR